MNGPIGKQMVDTLVESSSNVEVGMGALHIDFKPHDQVTRKNRSHCCNWNYSCFYIPHSVILM